MDINQLIKNAKPSGKKGSRKAGRNKSKCAGYRAIRSIKNKIRKLEKHISKHPNDMNAQAAMERVYG